MSEKPYTTCVQSAVGGILPSVLILKDMLAKLHKDHMHVHCSILVVTLAVAHLQ